MESKVKRAHVFVEGRVQGVFFRMWWKNAAQSLDLSDWVKNLDDGRGEAVFEGRKKKCEFFHWKQR